MGKYILKSLTFYLLILVAIKNLEAQNLNFQQIPSDKYQFGFLFNKPFYQTDGDVSFFTANYQLFCNIPLSSDFNLVGNIPYVVYKYDYTSSFFNYNYSYSYNKNGIGNIFIGVQTGPKINSNPKGIITFGFYLPTADEHAGGYGVFADYYNLQKYTIKSTGFYFNYAYLKMYEDGFNFGLELGPSLMIPTGNSIAKTELFAHYGLNGGIKVERLFFNIELTGIAILTESVDNFDDRFINLLSFGFQWKDETFTPKLYYQIFLRDQLKQLVDGILGIGVTVSLK